MTTASEIIKIARAEIGVREGRDSNGNWNNRVKYNAWYADKVNDNGFLTSAWCATFVSWVANKAGALDKIIPLHAWTPSGLVWFRKNATVSQGAGARVGDFFYVYYPNMGRVAHVGIVERVEGDFIVTIEGNTNTTGARQGNGVYRLRRKVNGNLYFAHPKYDKSYPSKPKVEEKPSRGEGARPALPKGAKPKLVGAVSVKELKIARETDPPKSGTPLGKYANQVFTLETALAKTKWIRKEHVDGHYGSSTIGDGSRGYGGTTGFQKKHSGTKNPDGWLGKRELEKLFMLAGMKVKVLP